jgi:hypothetical protein
MKPKKAENNTRRCDICWRDDIVQDNHFFFHCDFSCNYDLCPCCYYLSLMPSMSDTLAKFKIRGQQRKIME